MKFFRLKKCISRIIFACCVLPAFYLHAQPYGLTNRPAAGAFLDNIMPEAAPAGSLSWVAVPAFPNLYFTNILGVVPVPGTTNLLCAWEREGRVWIFTNDPSTSHKTLVLDISNQCQGWDDSGLLGLAFHPGFATNRMVFLCYTWVTPGTVAGNAATRPTEYVPGNYHDRLSRFTMTNGFFPTSSETVFVDQTGDSVWHNGAGMFFHPTNGFLYWSDGDDERFQTQAITNKLLSGVFRIDVDRRGGGISHPIPRQPASGFTTNYYIPNNNPFVGQPNALEEFFCLGLRNPYRMTIDPPSGRIYLGDVGENSREEVDIIEPGESGLNFQWNVIEGLNGDLVPPYPGINRRPVLDYPHTDGLAVIGGYVYRGSDYAAQLGSLYIFGDNVSRMIWALNESTVPATKIPLALLPKGDGINSGSDYTGLSGFGYDQRNELFICQMSSAGGRIFKLAPAVPVASRPLPTLLSQTGVFTNLLTLAPSPKLIPYDVNAPLWSDGAFKTRWMSLATNLTVGFAATGEWTFPNGSVFIKHFDLPVNDTNPAIRKRLETRLLVMGTNGLVYGASYKWRSDYSDADLVLTLTNETISITTASGSRSQIWTYPGRQECLICHTIPAGGVLGVKTRQLNGNFSYTATGVTDNQLRAWNHIGLFSPAVNEGAIAGYSRLVPISDTNATLELRARSFLDANCSQCHRPNGGVQAAFDARFDTPLENQGIIGAPLLNNLGITGAFVLAPGDTNKSVLFQRDNSVDTIKMPPVAKNVVDTNAMKVIASWIMSLPPLTNMIPAPWQHSDIGNIALPGNAIYAAGAFTVSAVGDDIWNDVDSFHYVFQPLAGNGTLTARVVSQSFTDGWAKAGVMLRESLARESAQAMMAMSVLNGAAFQYRSTTSGLTTHVGGSGAAPYWVRIVRTGNTFTGYTAADGVNWVQVGSTTIGMSNQIFAGLAVSSHNNATVNNSIFDNVTFTPAVTNAAAQPIYLLSAIKTNGQFKFSLQGSNGVAYVIEASTNMKTWIPVLTNTPTSNLLQYVETMTNWPARFYRGRLP